MACKQTITLTLCDWQNRYFFHFTFYLFFVLFIYYSPVLKLIFRMKLSSRNIQKREIRFSCLKLQLSDAVHHHRDRVSRHRDPRHGRGGGVGHRRNRRSRSDPTALPTQSAQQHHFAIHWIPLSSCESGTLPHRNRNTTKNNSVLHTSRGLSMSTDSNEVWRFLPCYLGSTSLVNWLLDRILKWSKQASLQKIVLSK